MIPILRMAAAILLVVLLALAPNVTMSQTAAPSGNIGFVRSGNIWEWSPEGTREILESGTATDPEWSPDGNEMIYVRDQGSFTDLMLTDFGQQGSDQLTDYESDAEVGSSEYVTTCYWAIDPAWSAAGVLVFGSDIDSADGTIQLRVMDMATGKTAVAPSDGADLGTIDQFDVNDDGTFAVYTVLAAGGENGGITYVALRDLGSGETTVLAEGGLGVYSPAISANDAFVAVSIRDDAGVSDLWVIDRTTDESIKLTEDMNAGNATWSPNGDWIAFTRLHDRSFEIWAMPVSTISGERQGDPVKIAGDGDIDSVAGLTWAN